MVIVTRLLEGHTITTVYALVRAHHSRCTCSDCVGKRPKIRLMHGFVVYVGTDSLDLETVDERRVSLDLLFVDYRC